MLPQAYSAKNAGNRVSPVNQQTAEKHRYITINS
jgi:hypothetical protein